MALLSYKFRLYPNRAQSDALTGMLGAFCDLYNAGLQQRIEAYRRRRISLRYLDQASELKAVRVCDERLARYSYSAEQQVLRRLDKAFKAFFRRLKERGGKAGFPRFQAKSRFDSAEFRVGDGLTIRKSTRLGITGIPGEIKVKWHRLVPEGAKVGAATLSLSYKAANAGGSVVLVDPRGTSQTCPECGLIRPKTLAERVHCCDCGCTLDRDVAAAQVVHLRGFGFGPGHGLQAITGPVAA